MKKKNFVLFSELSKSLIKVCRRLSEDQELCRLVKFPSKDAMERSLQPNESLFLKNITIIPSVDFTELEESKIVINLPEGDANEGNDEFADIYFNIDIFTTFDQWIINDDYLRPFKIMDRIINLINRTKITSIGEIVFQRFELEILSDEISCHRMIFMVMSNA